MKCSCPCVSEFSQINSGAGLRDPPVLCLSNCQTKPKGVTIHLKALDEYLLMVLFVIILKRVHFHANETKRCEHPVESSWWVPYNGNVCFCTGKSSFSYNVLFLTWFGQRNRAVKRLNRLQRFQRPVLDWSVVSAKCHITITSGYFCIVCRVLVVIVVPVVSKVTR